MSQPVDNTLEVDTRQVQAAFCKDCKLWIQVSAYPWCLTDRHSNRDYARYATAGHTVKVMYLTEWNALPSTPMCSCAAKPHKK